jgi:ribosomal-protein-alanine N-acetyltransferase
MSQPIASPFVVDALTPADIPAAIAVETAAYPTGFPHRNYMHELEHNRLAHYLALRAPDPAPELIGVAGYWLMAYETHIITIAIQPARQRLGLGEWLLLHLLEHGRTQGAQVATLEVRVGNERAIALYHKYQFQLMGRRRGYYSDTGEDALIMTTPPLHSPDYQAMLAAYKSQLAQRLAQITPGSAKSFGLNTPPEEADSTCGSATEPKN